MPYVKRDSGTNEIIQQFQRPQEGATEFLATTHADLVALALKKAKVKKWLDVKHIRADKGASGVVHALNTYDSEQISITNISLVLAGNDRAVGITEPFNWTLADNSQASITHLDLVTVYGLIVNLIVACHDQSVTFISQIDAATTQSELDAIDITAGWPTVPYTG